jgi:hypothetical protein
MTSATSVNRVVGRMDANAMSTHRHDWITLDRIRVHAVWLRRTERILDWERKHFCQCYEHDESFSITLTNLSGDAIIA